MRRGREQRQGCGGQQVRKSVHGYFGEELVAGRRRAGPVVSRDAGSIRPRRSRAVPALPGNTAGNTAFGARRPAWTDVVGKRSTPGTFTRMENRPPSPVKNNVFRSDPPKVRLLTLPMAPGRALYEPVASCGTTRPMESPLA